MRVCVRPCVRPCVRLACVRACGCPADNASNVVRVSEARMGLVNGRDGLPSRSRNSCPALQ